MRTTDFEPMLPKLVAAHFPTVERFEVDHMAHGVKPVEYHDGNGRLRREYPPVVTWRVGSQRYAYVLKPKLRRERWGVLCFGGTTVRADYKSEDDKLWQLLQWSVEGKTADEINRMLGNRQPNTEAQGRR